MTRNRQYKKIIVRILNPCIILSVDAAFVLSGLYCDVGDFPLINASVSFRAHSDRAESRANSADHGGGVSQRNAGRGVDGDGFSSRHLSLLRSAAVYSLRFPEPTTPEKKQ